MSILRDHALRVAIRILHFYFLVARGMTLGVRGACFDAQGRIFLVRHTYVPGWHLPGGGVERHQTCGEALAREAQEEGNLELVGAPRLFHVYYNRGATARDHVVLYRVDVIQTAPRAPDREIAECGFFALDQLPEETTASTRQRLKELSGEAPPDDFW